MRETRRLGNREVAVCVPVCREPFLHTTRMQVLQHVCQRQADVVEETVHQLVIANSVCGVVTNNRMTEEHNWTAMFVFASLVL